MAKAVAMPLPGRWGQVEGQSVFDLRYVRDLALLQSQWMEPLLSALRSGDVATASLEFADGARFVLRPGQRWRFWRRPLPSIAA